VGGSRDPAHDRVRLTPNERADFARLERSLYDGFEDPDHAVGSRRLVAARRWCDRAWAWLVRLAPWLALAAALAMPVAIARSNWAGAVCALALVATLTLWWVTSWRRFRDRLTARRSEPPSGRDA
jgi:hypothetical protein